MAKLARPGSSSDGDGLTAQYEQSRSFGTGWAQLPLTSAGKQCQTMAGVSQVSRRMRPVEPDL